MTRTLQLSIPFFASGAAALGLQLVWMKMFAAGLGHEVPSMLAVVSAFFGGMALGGWALDRRLAAAANFARWYAGLQWVAGGWAVLVTALIPGLNQVARTLMGVAPGGVWQGVVSFALPFVALLPATLAMGATLPAMDRWLATQVPEGRCVGRVYAVNTAGAMAGTWLAAFVLMPALGFRCTALVFAGMYLACGAAVWRARSTARHDRPDSSRATSTLSPVGSAWPWLGYAFVTGLLGIGFELVGVRVLAQVLENTIYTYAAALAVYLLGTALGAALYQRCARAAAFQKTLATLLGLLGLVCLVEVWVLSRSLWVYDAIHARSGDTIAGTLWTSTILACLVFGPATLLMGATFSHLAQGCRRADGGVGRAAAANTLGGGGAGLLFGVLLLPALGAGGTLVLLGLAYAALSLPVLIRGVRSDGTSRRSAWLVVGLGVPGVLVLALLQQPLRVLRLPEGATVREYREGVMASVAVLETPDGHRSLRVNNRFQMGGTAAALAQRRQAHIPLLLHPAPRRALLLGPGTGITLGAVREHPGVEAEGVELVPEVVDLMHYFEPENGGPFRRGEGREGQKGRNGNRPVLSVSKEPVVVCADARRFVRASREQYDVVIADLFHPAQDGAGFLYTREHFEAVRDRLAPGGLFCQWLPVHQLDEAMLRTIVATFLAVYPHTHAFLLHFNVDIPVIGLIGSSESWHVPPEAVERRLDEPGVRAAMKRSGLDRALNLLGGAVAGPAQLRTFAAQAAISTDDNPRVTFGAPRAGGRGAPVSALPGLLSRWRVDPAALLGVGQGVFVTQLSEFIAARDLYLGGLATEAEGQLAGAIDAYLESSRRSVYFTPAYARLVNIIQVLAGTDRVAARRLFERLEAAQPAQPLGRQMLGPMLRQMPNEQ